MLDALGDDAWTPILVGTATSAISGYLAIAWLLRYLQRKSLAPFALYRVMVGVALFALCVAGVLTPGEGP